MAGCFRTYYRTIFTLWQDDLFQDILRTWTRWCWLWQDIFGIMVSFDSNITGNLWDIFTRFEHHAHMLLIANSVRPSLKIGQFFRSCHQSLSRMYTQLRSCVKELCAFLLSAAAELPLILVFFSFFVLTPLQHLPQPVLKTQICFIK